MSSSCRSFLQSLSRSALVLSLENILALARPLRWRRVTSDGAEVSGSQAALTPGGELGVSFVNVAHECGLNAKTIFGGERKNKYLLETTGCGVAFYDYDNDGWPDIYVANDSVPSAVYRNKKNGKFVDVAMDAGCALSPDGKPQAGMGVSAGDYDLDGKLDILKTNFAGDTLSLYHNLGDGNFEDVTFTAGLGLHTQFLGWGCRFFDFDNAGWPDILICNGHVYPEVEELKTEAGYAQHKLPYRNLRNGRFEDVSVRGGPGISMLVAARGCAFGDFNSDGFLDVVVNTVNDYPQLLRCDTRLEHNWIKIRTIGTKSNRSGISARIRCVTPRTGETKEHSQIDEVRSGGSYISQNDLWVHFGIGKSRKSCLARSSLAEWLSGRAERRSAKSGGLCQRRRRDQPDDEVRSPFVGADVPMSDRRLVP